MRQMMRDVHAELLREIARTVEQEAGLAAGDGPPPVVITGVSSAPWFSATFAGRRHVVDIDLSGAAPAVIAARDILVARLPTTEFDLRGHFVASLAATPLDVRRDGDRTLCELRVEALTVED